MKTGLQNSKYPLLMGKLLLPVVLFKHFLQRKREEKSYTEQVKVIKLDEWAALEHFNRLDFIKIDVEGNEIKTLSGARETIRQFKPTLMVEMEQRHHETPIWK